MHKPLVRGKEAASVALLFSSTKDALTVLPRNVEAAIRDVSDANCIHVSAASHRFSHG
jgi:hypothetical protein